MRENLVMAYLPQRDPTEVIGRRIDEKSEFVSSSDI